jgi:hypothetical protein
MNAWMLRYRGAQKVEESSPSYMVSYDLLNNRNILLKLEQCLPTQAWMVQSTMYNIISFAPMMRVMDTNSSMYSLSDSYIARLEKYHLQSSVYKKKQPRGEG